MVLVVLALLASACHDDPPPTQPGGPARQPTMAIVSGNGQTAEVATSLAAPLVVRVADSLGAPARGVVVRLLEQQHVGAGLQHDGCAGDGVHPVDARQPRREPGDIIARATVYAAAPYGIASVAFTAHATPGATTTLALSGGDGAVAAPGSSVDTVTVTATDRFGNATPLVPVDWLVRIGGGTVRPIAARTDAQGTASAIWVMGPADGPNAMDVTVGAVTREVTATASIAFPATAVAVGETHSCALASSGAAYCWGANSSGQLGVRRIDDNVSTTPQRVAGALSFVSLAAGANHTCGLTADGAAYCWGNGRSGQLGVGAPGLSSAPSRVPGLYVTLAAGARHTCGLSAATPLTVGGQHVRPTRRWRRSPHRPRWKQGLSGPGFRDRRDDVHRDRGRLQFDVRARVNGGTYCWGANRQRASWAGTSRGRCTVIGTQSLYDGTTPLPCSAAPVRLDLPALVSLAVNKSGWCGVPWAARSSAPG